VKESQWKEKLVSTGRRRKKKWDLLAEKVAIGEGEWEKRKSNEYRKEEEKKMEFIGWKIGFGKGEAVEMVWI
jgi:hypothetical protein